METEILFTASKWGILKAVSENASSPLEIAKQLGTTIANVSQQLRLLEASGLVAKTTVPNFEPGKPRALYSLTGNFAFLTLLSFGKAQKELVSLTKEQQFQLNLWFYSNKNVVGPLSKLFFSNEHLFKEISELRLKSATSSSIILEEVNNNSVKINKFNINYNNKNYSIVINKVKVATESSYILIKEDD